SGHDITLSFCDAPSMTARGHFRQINPLPTRSACPLRSDRVRTFAPQRIDAVCHSTKSLRDSGEVRLVLRASPEKRLLVASEAPCLRIGPSLTSSNMVRQWCA